MKGEKKLQEQTFTELFRLLIDKFEEKELDYFKISDHSEPFHKGWEVVEVVFKPKGE